LHRLSVIDIGTNSVLYQLVEKKPDGTIVPDIQDIRNVRLGEGLSPAGIRKAAQDRLLPILHDFKKLAESHHCDRTVIVGTRVFRAASNAEDICRRVLSETDLHIEILSPQEEAIWSFYGAVYDQSEKMISVIDIGGGSTEISSPDKDSIQSVSMNIGAVTLTERHFRHDPPLSHEIQAANGEIDTALRSAGHINHPGARWIGTGGTVTTLAAMHMRLKQYKADRVHGQNLSMRHIRKLLETMTRQTLIERQKQIPFDPSRADIIIAGTLILNRMMTTGACQTLTISDRGLRFGIALRELAAVSKTEFYEKG